MRKSIFFLLVASSLFGTSIEQAMVQKVIPNTQIAGVKKSKSDLYAVCQSSGDVIYVNTYDELILWGEIWTNRGINLTEKDNEWCKSIVVSNFDEKKVQELINNGAKVVNGKGSSEFEFIVFKSPFCPHCIEFTETTKKLNITIYEYMSPSRESENIYKEYGIKNPKELLTKQQEVTKDMTIDGVPLILVIKNNKVIDTIKGFAEGSSQHKKLMEYVK